MTPAASLCDGHARACPTQPLGTDLPSRSSSQDQAGLIRRAATSPKRGEPPMASTRAPPRDRVVIGDEQKASVEGIRCLTLNACTSSTCCRGIKAGQRKGERQQRAKAKVGRSRRRGVLGLSLRDDLAEEGGACWAARRRESGIVASPMSCGRRKAGSFPPCTPLSAPPDQGATSRVRGACKAQRASGGGKRAEGMGRVSVAARDTCVATEKDAGVVAALAA